MNQIQSVLNEELERCQRLLVKYQEELDGEPEGSLVKKVIKGKVYYYLAQRQGKKVVFQYLGKLNDDDIEKYEKSKVKKLEYRKHIKDLKKQIAYLKKVIKY